MSSKKFYFFNFFVFLSLVFLYSCIDNHKQDQSRFDSTSVTHTMGGGVDKKTITVKGVFKRKNDNCRSGFGLCEVQVVAPDNNSKSVDSLQNRGVENYNALLSLSENTDILHIEFLENIPQFADQFIVDDGEVITGIEDVSVFTVPGTYTADKTIGQFGGVDVKVKGKK